MIEVRRKITGTSAHLGTMVEVPATQNMIVVAGAAKATVEKMGEANVLLAGLPLDFYADRDAARRDGWIPV